MLNHFELVLFLCAFGCYHLQKTNEIQLDHFTIGLLMTWKLLTFSWKADIHKTRIKQTNYQRWTKDHDHLTSARHLFALIFQIRMNNAKQIQICIDIFIRVRDILAVLNILWIEVLDWRCQLYGYLNSIHHHKDETSMQNKPIHSSYIQLNPFVT